MPTKKKWIPRKMKKGALSRQLGISEKDNIPKTLLEKIKAAKIGTTLRIPPKAERSV